MTVQGTFKTATENEFTVIVCRTREKKGAPPLLRDECQLHPPQTQPLALFPLYLSDVGPVVPGFSYNASNSSFNATGARGPLPPPLSVPSSSALEPSLRPFVGPQGGLLDSPAAIRGFHALASNERHTEGWIVLLTALRRTQTQVVDAVLQAGFLPIVLE